MANDIQLFTIQTGQITTGNPETVVNDATATNLPGALIKWNGNVYRYVQHHQGTGTVASAAGGAAHWKTLTINPGATAVPTFLVSSDQTDALAVINGVAGIYKGVVTHLYYTWLGVGGTHSVICANSVVAGDYLIGGTTDLQLERIASAGTVTGLIFGIALESKSGTITGQALALLQHMVW